MPKLKGSREEFSSIAATRTLRIEATLSSLSRPRGGCGRPRAHGCWSGHPAAHFSNGSHIRNLTETKGVGWPRNGLLSAVKHKHEAGEPMPCRAFSIFVSRPRTGRRQKEASGRRETRDGSRRQSQFGVPAQISTVAIVDSCQYGRPLNHPIW